MSCLDKYIDKATVFVLCSVFYVQYETGVYIIVPIICTVIISTFMSYLDKEKIAAALALIYFVLCFFYPAFLFYLPVICYDLFVSKVIFGLPLAAVPLITGYDNVRAVNLIFILLITGLSYLMSRRTAALNRLKHEYISLRDRTKEFSISLENKNKELMDKQDYEINLATLNERNRIARDIHDSVGHLLSNSILQTGALLAVCKDENTKQHLSVLKDTLVTGMEAIRSSVHGLYDESLDLHTELKKLCDDFNFCGITFNCDMEGSPDKKIKYALLSVVREALSNVIRHSDATHVAVSLQEHRSFYRLIVRDNGSKKEINAGGIGLKNITQRVTSLGGLVNIGYEGGFSVFVSIPKGEVKEQQ
jgi:signal transduction histidine kinase